MNVFRYHMIIILCIFFTILIIFDNLNSEINPFNAPNIISLGSNEENTRGFCGDTYN